MTFELRGVENIGDLERERVVLRATSEADIGDYAVFRCRASGDEKVLSGNVPAAYWFVDRKVKSGDFVVLYSKTGETGEKTNENGNTSYFFYWGYSKPQWSGFIAVLVETGRDWSRSKGVLR